MRARHDASNARPRGGPVPASEPVVSRAALFTHDALYRAWRITRRNGPSPGVDRLSLRQFERNLTHELGKLRAELLDGRYRPQPVKRFYKVKPSGKKRALSIWTARDRVAQRVILDYITPILEARYLPCSYGFRPGRRVSDAVEAVMRGYNNGLRWVVDADIADCFDSIPVMPLLKVAQTVIPAAPALELIHAWLHTPIAGEPGKIVGVSQGGVISPQLTNMYLHTFDLAITRQLPGTALVRFADDFIILCRHRVIAQAGLMLARRTLAGLGLQVNNQKTRIIPFDSGFTFLGVPFHAGGHGPLPGSTDNA